MRASVPAEFQMPVAAPCPKVETGSAAGCPLFDANIGILDRLRIAPEVPLDEGVEFVDGQLHRLEAGTEGCATRT